MNVLWFAFGIYIVGVSALLILQPKMMFENKVWKEFGLHNTTRATVFPVWMFIVLWSFLSYGVASLMVTMFSNLASGSFEQGPFFARAGAGGTGDGATNQESIKNSVASRVASRTEEQLLQLQDQVTALLESQESQKPEMNHQSTTPEQAPSIKNSLPYHRRRLRRRHAKTGYYVRNNSGADGPKYIYYGEEPPQ